MSSNAMLGSVLVCLLLGSSWSSLKAASKSCVVVAVKSFPPVSLVKRVISSSLYTAVTL